MKIVYGMENRETYVDRVQPLHITYDTRSVPPVKKRYYKETSLLCPLGVCLVRHWNWLIAYVF
jgi:hypothetical protein